MKNKYIAIIDLKGSNQYIQKELSSKDLISAMSEAEQYFNDNVYFISIAEKSGKMYKYNNCKCIDYIEMLVNRKSGWYVKDESHGEHFYIWRKMKYNEDNWFELKF